MVSKEQFIEVCDKHKPNGWIRFAYRYFSQMTTHKDSFLNEIIVTILVTLFVLGFFGTMWKMRKLTAVVTIPFAILLTTLVLYLFSAVILNKFRINKICKELHISKKEYNDLVQIYFE